MKPRKLGRVIHSILLNEMSKRLDTHEALILELRNRANKHGWFPESENAPAPPAVAVPEEVNK